MIKLEDEDGQIHTIRQIDVHSKTKKNYAGTPSVEFNCTVILQEREIQVKLIYYQTENRWVMNFR